MTPSQKVALGILFFLLGLGYLYRPDLIERMNALLREYLFNDAHLALERRKWGMFFLLLSFLFLYMGYSTIDQGLLWP
ncbi:MAG: hypothetical protein HY554_00730 [Elusimicrobia bacterium]|nr:hypothetical protein [Elusimicrobiota bacterium]